MNILKGKRSILSVLSLSLLLCGCIEFETYALKVNFVSGEIEHTYRNLTSDQKKLLGDGDSVESDWMGLKHLEKQPLTDEEAKTKGFVGATAKLFDDGGALSGTISCRFAKPDSALEGRLDLLNKRLSDFGVLKVVDGMIYLFGKDGSEMVSTNGRVLNPEMKQAVVITWPKDTKDLEVAFRGKSTRSLLSFYQAERQKAQ